MSAYAEGKKAFGFCDRCGFRYKLKELKAETVNLASTNLLVCPECWDPDQPQNMLGRLRVDDPQALRNPRPLGGISGRDLPAAYRCDFSTGTAQTDPTRIDGWWAVNGTLTWNQSREALNIVAITDSGPIPGDPYIYRGYNGESKTPDYLSIDTSVYKYVVTQFTVNNYPLKEVGDLNPPDGFQGQFYWSTSTDPSDSGISEAKSQRCQSQPYFKLTQPSDGFAQSDRDMASTFKIVFDMTDDPEWTGTVSTIRLDYFDARPGDLGAGDIDVDYIEVVAFHNPDL
tara:strand:+ start:6386 stop:7240 length:855 start_codon:yes stop_codon:yes gene_type:complete